MSTHYVGMLYHSTNHEECTGHGLQAFERRSDAVAIAIEELDLSEQDELTLLETGSISVRKADTAGRRFGLRVGITECECSQFIADVDGLNGCDKIDHDYWDSISDDDEDEGSDSVSFI